MEIVRSHDETGITFHFKDGFTFADHIKFRSVIEAISHEKVDAIYINLQDVPYIDSAGLGMLLLARDQAQQARKILTLLHPRQQVKKMFELSQFKQLFTILE
jgi:anti-anti-sigma factor